MKPRMLVLLVLLSLMLLPACNADGGSLFEPEGKVDSFDTHLVYTPPGLEEGKVYPLVFALSPNADADGMINRWRKVAVKHLWIVAASKTFQNERSMNEIIPELEAQLNQVEKDYPVNRRWIIFSGFSGGGMGSHAMAQYFPKRVAGVVVNTGLIHPNMRALKYPNSKFAVFLASPTDFNYEPMKDDQQFLRSKGWATAWIEFEGGHTLAPVDAYEQALQWFAEQGAGAQ